ncbi:hypothetical protein B0H15DRAFT_925432 [Mycena belliarum]|uniref:Uncharacterized protein n=1 Tax=Mycena belliarum TaxID=1033014 RepID=A0AAD6XJI2_9AGAR|nr:hypothetical protein B0H15DRAFT_925432 [Mycena belliae]
MDYEGDAAGYQSDSMDFDGSDNNDAAFDPPQPESPGEEVRANEGPHRNKRPRATVEEVEDEDDRWYQTFPDELAAGAILERCKTQFEKLREEQTKAGQPPWAPFASEEEWELAHWLMTSGISQSKTDEFLNLKKVNEGMKPSFHNNRAFLQRIDALPEGPKWSCYPFKLKGDELDADGALKTEIVEMWCRDPVDCVKELLGNPAFTKQCYEPCRVFKDAELTNREYNEMWTGNWWWTIQELLPPGSTLVPIILASDKTQLTRFSGDKQAWPVYLTIGNIDKETRRSPSSRATVLIGYIPVSKFEIFSKKRRSGVAHQLFHDCMGRMLDSLKAAGREGVLMDCADGFVRKAFPILAAYIADYPEQCLVACCRENSCPACSCGPRQRGETDYAPLRDPTETLDTLLAQSLGDHPPEFRDQNLRPINPFWANFPHCNIFACMTPDLLHELHNGAFGDHTVKWSTAATTGAADEIDRRFRAMAPHPTLRHFKNGIALTSQWTGTERKNMEKVFLGILANATDPRVQTAVRGILDFIYYAHFENHCDESLAELDSAWASFHAHKDIFVDLRIRTHFNINKIHKLKHYVDSIRSRGTADGFNTEGSERLHIDLAKAGYNASNKRAYTRQMTVWLRRQESIHKFGTYLQWAVPGYSARFDSSIDADEEEAEAPVNLDTLRSDDPAVEVATETPRSQASVTTPAFTLAKTPPFPNLTAGEIAAEFHAPDFIGNIARFLESKSIIPRLIPASNTTFPVYKSLSITLPLIPEVGSRRLFDKVRAVRGEPAKHTSKGVFPAKAGLSVARLRVIFRIPSDFGLYTEPVAYVDWFKPLQAPSPTLGMHQVSLSSRGHRQNSSIIPVTDIVRSCHLIPVFGRKVDPRWTSETVLDQCKSFYLNPYLSHYDFYFFRYLVAVYTRRKAAEERRTRIRLLGRAGR